MQRQRITQRIRQRRSRHGSATLWMLMWLPCLLVLFCVLVGVANLWLARIELENALESAALAAVKEWGDAGGGDTLVPRKVGVAYARANSVRRDLVVIGTNYSAAGGVNENDQCVVGVSPPTANLIFGAVDHTDPNNVIFNAGEMADCPAINQRFAVRAQAIVPVQPLGFGPFLGTITQYNVQAKTTAEYDCSTHRVRLIRVDSFICPGP